MNESTTQEEKLDGVHEEAPASAPAEVSEQPLFEEKATTTPANVALPVPDDEKLTVSEAKADEEKLVLKEATASAPAKPHIEEHEKKTEDATSGDEAPSKERTGETTGDRVADAQEIPHDAAVYLIPLSDQRPTLESHQEIETDGKPETVSPQAEQLGETDAPEAVVDTLPRSADTHRIDLGDVEASQEHAAELVEQTEAAEDAHESAAPVGEPEERELTFDDCDGAPRDLRSPFGRWVDDWCDGFGRMTPPTAPLAEGASGSTTAAAKFAEQAQRKASL